MRGDLLTLGAVGLLAGVELAKRGSRAEHTPVPVRAGKLVVLLSEEGLAGQVGWSVRADGVTAYPAGSYVDFTDTETGISNNVSQEIWDRYARPHPGDAAWQKLPLVDPQDPSAGRWWMRKRRSLRGSRAGHEVPDPRPGELAVLVWEQPDGSATAARIRVLSSVSSILGDTLVIPFIYVDSGETDWTNEHFWSKQARVYPGDAAWERLALVSPADTARSRWWSRPPRRSLRGTRRSLRGTSNKKPALVARNPKQGLALIEHPDVTANYEKSLRVKRKHKIAVLVPCAGTKPFPRAPSHKHGYLPALDGADADVYVVAEPLGVVPYAWSQTYPNDAYDFPPEHLKGKAFDLLAERIGVWFDKIGSRYDKIVLALPGHHRRLVRAATKDKSLPLVEATITECRSHGACDSGVHRATHPAYKRYLTRTVGMAS